MRRGEEEGRACSRAPLVRVGPAVELRGHVRKADVVRDVDLACARRGRLLSGGARAAAAPVSMPGPSVLWVGALWTEASASQANTHTNVPTIWTTRLAGTLQGEALPRQG